MTSFVYPTLPGLTFDVLRTPMWHNENQTALSGKRSSLSYMRYPLIHFEHEYSVLRDDLTLSQLKQIVGLFNACQGSYDTFLFTDPDFNTITPANAAALGSIGIGDGATTLFQIVAYYQNAGGPGYGELIQNINGTPTIYVNGTAQTSGYTVGPTGIVTFNSAPASGASVTWSGSWYYRCSFDEDKLDLTKFMNQWWTIKKLPFTSIKL